MNIIEAWIKFVKGHEKLVVVVIIALACYWTAGRALGAWERHDEKAASRGAAKSQADAQAAQAKGQENAALLAELAALRAQVDATNERLDAETAQRQRETQAQQQRDAALPPSGLAVRWLSLAQLPTDSVKVAGDSFLVTGPGAVGTVQRLEDLPRLQADLDAARQEKAGVDSELSKASDTIVGLNVQVALDKTAEASAAKACSEQIKVERDKARKGKFKWFGIGYVAGFASSAVLKAFVINWPL